MKNQNEIVSLFLRSLQRSYRFVGRLLTPIIGWQPFSVRGLLALTLSLVSLKVFAFPESDLVATMIGGGLLGILTLCVLTLYFSRFRLGKSLSAQLRFDEHQALSKTPVPAGIILSGSHIPPFFSLKVRREFLHRGADSSLHLVKGKDNGEMRHLIDTVSFAHRGYWPVQRLALSLGDSLGLTRLSWTLAVESGVEVSAATIPIRDIPVVAASARAGDQLSETRDRAGDLFDIKAYDPSDGVRKILWKTFAKSGQLVVRRPEPAVIPEGEVAIYLVAGIFDDHVAGALQSYLQQLEANQITILFGTDGLSGTNSRPETEVKITNDMAKDVNNFRGKHIGVVTARDEIRHTINHSVWAESAGTGRDFALYLESLKGANRLVHRVVIFAPERNDGWFEEIEKQARHFLCELTVVLVPLTVDPVLSFDLAKKKFAYNLSAVRTGSRLRKRLYSVAMLTNTVTNTKSREGSPEEKRSLATAIARSGVQLLLCEGRESLN